MLKLRDMWDNLKYITNILIVLKLYTMGWILILHNKKYDKNLTFDTVKVFLIHIDNY